MDIDEFIIDEPFISVFGMGDKNSIPYRLIEHVAHHVKDRLAEDGYDISEAMQESFAVAVKRSHQQAGQSHRNHLE